MEQEILQRQARFGKLKVSLKLFVDTLGLLRLKGQFENAALDYDEKSHERVLHHGTETTLNYVRSKIWIVKGRKADIRVF